MDSDFGGFLKKEFFNILLRKASTGAVGGAREPAPTIGAAADYYALRQLGILPADGSLLTAHFSQKGLVFRFGFGISYRLSIGAGRFVIFGRFFGSSE